VKRPGTCPNSKRRDVSELSPASDSAAAAREATVSQRKAALLSPRGRVVPGADARAGKDENQRLSGTVAPEGSAAAPSEAQLGGARRKAIVSERSAVLLLPPNLECPAALRTIADRASFGCLDRRRERALIACPGQRG
jgi:hypothetical protein